VVVNPLIVHVACTSIFAAIVVVLESLRFAFKASSSNPRNVAKEKQ
jgi:tRNA(Phe) wybutosine-synthesizing methylase Tyw3